MCRKCAMHSLKAKNVKKFASSHQLHVCHVFFACTRRSTGPPSPSSPRLPHMHAQKATDGKKDQPFEATCIKRRRETSEKLAQRTGGPFIGRGSWTKSWLEWQRQRRVRTVCCRFPRPVMPSNSWSQVEAVVWISTGRGARGAREAVPRRLTLCMYSTCPLHAGRSK